MKIKFLAAGFLFVVANACSNGEALSYMKDESEDKVYSSKDFFESIGKKYGLLETGTSEDGLPWYEIKNFKNKVGQNLMIKPCYHESYIEPSCTELTTYHEEFLKNYQQEEVYKSIGTGTKPTKEAIVNTRKLVSNRWKSFSKGIYAKDSLCLSWDISLNKGNIAFVRFGLDDFVVSGLNLKNQFCVSYVNADTTTWNQGYTSAATKVVFYHFCNALSALAKEEKLPQDIESPICVYATSRNDNQNSNHLLEANGFENVSNNNMYGGAERKTYRLKLKF